MIGHYICNTIMKAARLTYKECEEGDIGRGISKCFDEYRNEWSRTSFELPVDNAVIKGEYITNPQSSASRKKVALICHGLTANRMAALKYASIFYKLGYNLIIFDERYYGESTGEYCTLGYREKEDAKKLLAYARSVFGEDAYIAVQGESMGAAISLLILDTEKPAMVIADCPFSDTEMLLKEAAFKQAFILGPAAVKTARHFCIKRDNYDFRKVVPFDSVKNTDVPICFMHGKADTLINYNHSIRMHAVCKNKLSEIHLFEGADHAQSIFSNPSKYEEIMTAFIKKMEAKDNM